MKTRTLKENRDFRRVYRCGKSKAGPVLVTYALKSRMHQSRVGITSAKKIGNAVHRNRARRVIREAFCEFEGSLCANYDIVFVARTKTTFVKMQTVREAMKAQLAELGVIAGE